MSSVNAQPRLGRSGSPKVLLRSTSFQKLCSLPYSFKIEAIQSYKEHIKTVIKLLKVATRAYIVAISFQCIPIVLLNRYISSLYSALKGHWYATGDVSTAASKCSDESVTSTPVDRNARKKDIITPPAKQTIALSAFVVYKTAIQTFLTYTCIVYVGLQTVWLLNALWWSSNIPYGLVFLMLDLAYMGFIMSKIALHGTYSP